MSMKKKVELLAKMTIIEEKKDIFYLSAIKVKKIL